MKASDFAFSVERALKLGWSAAGFLTSTIVGASDYAKGKAKTVSGITTDDATGKVTVHLVAALRRVRRRARVRRLRPVHAGRQHADEARAEQPAGRLRAVRDQERPAERRVRRRHQPEPTPPRRSRASRPGNMNVHVKIESNTTTEASEVLNNTADVFDWGDTIPPALIQQVERAERPLQGGPGQQDVLLVPERDREAVQQPAGARGGGNRDRPSGAVSPGQRHAGPGLLPAAAADGGAPERAPARTAPRTPRRTSRRPSSWCSSPEWRVSRSPCGPRTAAASAVGGELRRHAERDRLQGDDQDDRRRGLLLDDRDAEEPPADGLRRLAAGLPEPDRLLPELGRRERDRASGEPELRGGQRPAHPVGAEGPLRGAGQPSWALRRPGGRRSTST